MHPLLKFAGRIVPPSLKQRFKEDLARHFQAPSVELTLKNMRHLGFNPAAIVDVGAHIGEWSLLAHEVFPQASILMIEAQENKASALDKVVQSCPENIHRRIALLGPETRDGVPFRESDDAPTGSSVLTCRQPITFQVIPRKMETLDSVLMGAGITNPDFLKIDVQGYELEVLKGAPKTLAATEVVLLELSTLELYVGSPLFHEMVAFMHSQGYHAFDICTLMRHQGTLVQVDVVFVKVDSPLFAKATKQL